MKKFKKLIPFLIVIVAFIVMAYNTDGVKDYRELKEGGECVLYPTGAEDKITTTKNRGRSTTTHTYWIDCDYEFQGKKLTTSIKAGKLLGSNSYDVVRIAVATGNGIKMNVFYTDDNMYFSKEATTKEEFIKEQLEMPVIITIGLAILLIVPLFELAFIKKFSNSYGKIADDMMEPRIICYHTSYFYAVLNIFCFGLAALFGFGSKSFVSNEEPEAVAIMFMIFAVVFAFLGLVFFFTMWNRMVVIYDNKIVQRGIFGKRKDISFDEVIKLRTVNSSKRKEVWVKSPGCRIVLSDNGSNYYEARDFLYEHISVEG